MASLKAPLDGLTKRVEQLRNAVWVHATAVKVGLTRQQQERYRQMFKNSLLP